MAHFLNGVSQRHVLSGIDQTILEITNLQELDGTLVTVLDELLRLRAEIKQTLQRLGIKELS